VEIQETIWTRDGVKEALVAPSAKLTRFESLIKRTMDIMGSAMLLILLSPIMLASWLVLMVTTNGKPIFRQTRLGKCGLPFVMYKFRSMVPNAEDLKSQVENDHDGPIFKNYRDPRITRLGHIMRRTSVDELPQLFHVLTGHMSLVGPRPMVVSEFATFEPWQLERLAVKPGLTCLWQVSGRSQIGFEEWMQMDIWYVENQSLMTDLKLLLRTPLTVLGRRGAY